MTIHVETRQQLSDAIRKYLNDEISAFEFDEIIYAIKTDDDTVNWCVLELWNYYDDIVDHKVVLSKEEWDYFQRILLVLESEGEITRQLTKVSPKDQYIVPFGSVQDILRTRKKCSHFSKQAYRTEIKDRKIRNWIWETVLNILSR